MLRMLSYIVGLGCVDASLWMYVDRLSAVFVHGLPYVLDVPVHGPWCIMKYLCLHGSARSNCPRYFPLCMHALVQGCDCVCYFCWVCACGWVYVCSWVYTTANGSATAVVWFVACCVVSNFCSQCPCDDTRDFNSGTWQCHIMLLALVHSCPGTCLWLWLQLLL